MKRLTRFGWVLALGSGACTDVPSMMPVDAQGADRTVVDSQSAQDSAATSDAQGADSGAMDVASNDASSGADVTDAGARTDAMGCPSTVGDDGNGVFPSYCSCVPNTTRACSVAPAAMANVGACRRGVQRCVGSGELGSWGASCEGAIGPVTEVCGNSIDDDCDGMTDEDCGCTVGATMNCYSGPAGTAGVGACRNGTRRCMAGSPATFGACTDEVVPRSEVCGNSVDDDCDGSVDEDCATCSPATVAWPIPVGTTGGPECIRTGGGTCEAMLSCTGSSCGAAACGQPHCGTLRCNDGSYVRPQYCTVRAMCTGSGIVATGFSW